MIYLICILAGLLIGIVGTYFLLTGCCILLPELTQPQPIVEELPPPRYAKWHSGASGFQQCWLWQFGPGPFEIVAHHETPDSYEPGLWFELAIGDGRVTFHSKWLLPCHEGPDPNALYSVMIFPGWAKDWYTICYNMTYKAAAAWRFEAMRVYRLKSDQVCILPWQEAEEYKLAKKRQSYIELRNPERWKEGVKAPKLERPASAKGCEQAV